MSTAPQPASVALLYHRVSRVGPDPFRVAVSPENFAEHIAVIAKRRPISLSAALDEIDGGAVAPGGVVVTFDDAYRDNLTEARPVLERYGVPATVFVTTGITGSRRAFWWEELARIMLEVPAGHPPARMILADDACEVALDGPDGPTGALWEVWGWLRRRSPREIEQGMEQLRRWACRAEPLSLGDDLRVMNADELQDLARGGLVDLGAHTRTHPVLATRPGHEQDAEIAGSRADLQEMLGRKVDTFAYPFGKPQLEFSERSVQAVREAGYRAACAVAPSPLTAGVSRFAIPRYTVPVGLDGDGFERWLSEGPRPPARPPASKLAALRERIARMGRR